MRPLIAGNGKMHGLAAQLPDIEAMAAFVQATPPEADVLICLPDNAAAILGSRDVGGVLIGRASLKSADFDAVLRTLPSRA